MSNWVRFLRSPNNVKRYFISDVPVLSQLRLLRVVLGPNAVTVALGFPGIPAGATDKWRRHGYTAVDLILRMSKPTIEHLDSVVLLIEQAAVSVDLSHGRIAIKNACGPILTVSAEYLDAEFVPDPVMQRVIAYRDEYGSDLEASPFLGDG